MPADPTPTPPGRLPRRPATPAEAAALASAIRLRILRLTYHDPLTNKEIAERLGRDPATTLHHVRKLVDTGFLEPMPPRRGTRGAREKPYRATGLSWSLDQGEGEEAHAMHEAMLQAYLGEVVDVGVLNVMQSRLALRLDEDQIEDLRCRLAELLNDFAARPAMAGRPLTGVYLAVYPMAGN